MFSPPLKKSIVFLKYALKMDLVKGEWFDLYVLDENDVALGIEDIDTSDAANIFTIKTRDGSVFEIETRKIE